MSAEESQSLGWGRERLGPVLAPELAQKAEPEQGQKRVAWSGLRVAVLSKRAVGAQALHLFSEAVVEPPDWVQGWKHEFRVKWGDEEAQVKLGV